MSPDRYDMDLDVEIKPPAAVDEYFT